MALSNTQRPKVQRTTVDNALNAQALNNQPASYYIASATSGSGGNTIYTGDGTIVTDTGVRTVDLNSNQLVFLYGSNTFTIGAAGVESVFPLYVYNIINTTSDLSIGGVVNVGATPAEYAEKHIILVENTTPPTSSINKGSIYIKDTDHKLYYKDESGTEYNLISNGTSSLSGSFTGSLNGTSSWATNALTASFTPNALITASVSSNTLTFTKGNDTTFSLTIATGSGGGTPGGSNTQIQYNNSSVFAGASNLTYNSSSGETTADYLIVSNNLEVQRQLLLTGGQSVSSTSYTITPNDFLLLVDTTSNTVDIDLTGASTNGKILVIKDSGGNALSNNITFTGTIDGSTFLIDKNLACLTLLYNGNIGSWLIISYYAP